MKKFHVSKLVCSVKPGTFSGNDGGACPIFTMYICIFISVWICKNMAKEISLIYPLTESRRRTGFFFSQLLFVYLIGKG